MKILDTLVFTLTAISLIGCNSHRADASSAQKEANLAHLRAPLINQTQLKMIQSTEPGIADLGWASVAYQLKAGALPTIEQRSILSEYWRSRPTLAGARSMRLLKDNAFSLYTDVLDQSEGRSRLSMDNRKILQILNSKSPVELEVAAQLLEDMSFAEDTTGYSEFLNGARSSNFEASTLHPFKLNRNVQWKTYLTSPLTSLSVDAGVLKQDQQASIQVTQRRGDGGNIQLNRFLNATSTDVLSLEELTRHPSIMKQGLSYDRFFRPFVISGANKEIRCAVARARLRAQSSGAYSNNINTDEQLLLNYVCASFGLTDAPSSEFYHSIRYQLAFTGSNSAPAPGRYNENPSQARDLNAFLNWFEITPAFKAEFTQAVDSRSIWVGLKMSKKLSQYQNSNLLFSQYPEAIGEALCISGCIYPKPVSQSSDGVLIFALNGSGSVSFSIITPAPFVDVSPDQAAVFINIDLLQNTQIQWTDSLDVSEFPALIQSLRSNEVGKLMSSLASALDRNGWALPELESGDIEASISLHRLNLLGEVLSSDAVKAVVPTLDSREFRTSILAAHSRNSLNKLEKNLVSKMKQEAFLARIEKEFAGIALHLESFSQDYAQELVVRTTGALGVDSPGSFKDPAELTEAVYGAWHLIKEELKSIQAGKKHLCNSLKKMSNLNLDATKSGIQQPKPGSLEACRI